MKLRRRRSEFASSIAAPEIYYASDVHGSDVCWRKFLGAARFYKADSLIMGGDLTGKAFRIAHMGHVNAPMILGILSVIEVALGALGIPHNKGGTQAAIDWLSDQVKE